MWYHLRQSSLIKLESEKKIKRPKKIILSIKFKQYRVHYVNRGCSESGGGRARVWGCHATRSYKIDHKHIAVWIAPPCTELLDPRGGGRDPSPPPDPLQCLDLPPPDPLLRHSPSGRPPNGSAIRTQWSPPLRLTDSIRSLNASHQ